MRLGAEVRGFLPLPRRIVLAGAAFGEETHGDPPFTLLPKLGSSRWLRGFREGRFRDRVAWAAQTDKPTKAQDHCFFPLICNLDRKEQVKAD